METKTIENNDVTHVEKKIHLYYINSYSNSDK